MITTWKEKKNIFILLCDIDNGCLEMQINM